MTICRMFAVVAFCLIFFIPHPAQSGNTATATITATALRVLKIERLTSLIFGHVQAGSNGGSVRIDADANRRLASGDVRTDTPSDFSRALFAVSGDAGKQYHIQLPSGVTAENTNAPGVSLGVRALEAFSVNANAITDAGYLDASGKDRIYVGGTLDVPPGAPSGVYRAQFDITVAYQ